MHFGGFVAEEGWGFVVENDGYWSCVLRLLGVMGGVLLAAMDVLWWSCGWRFSIVLVGVLVTGRGFV